MRNKFDSICWRWKICMQASFGLLFRFIAADVWFYCQLKVKLLQLFSSIHLLAGFSLGGKTIKFCLFLDLGLPTTNYIVIYSNQHPHAGNSSLFFLSYILNLVLHWHCFILRNILTLERRLTPLGQRCNCEFIQKQPDTKI